MNPDDFRYNELVPAPPAPNLIRPNVRAALDYLDNILSRGGQDAQDLWDILTAFRGPDTPNENPYEDTGKREVTLPIRRAALPLTLQSVCESRNVGPSFYYSNPGVHRRASFGAKQYQYPYGGARLEGSNHFRNHGFRAARALGLI